MINFLKMPNTKADLFSGGGEIMTVEPISRPLQGRVSGVFSEIVLKKTYYLYLWVSAKVTFYTFFNDSR